MWSPRDWFADALKFGCRLGNFDCAAIFRSGSAGDLRAWIWLSEDQVTRRLGLRFMPGEGLEGESAASGSVTVLGGDEVARRNARLGRRLQGVLQKVMRGRRWPVGVVCVPGGDPALGVVTFVQMQGQWRPSASRIKLVSGHANLILEATRLLAEGQLPGDFTQLSTEDREATGRALSLYQRGRELTAREKEVLGLICLGLTTKAISERLNIGFKTAQTHRLHIMEKLDAHNAVELTKAAMALGFFDWA